MEYIERYQGAEKPTLRRSITANGLELGVGKMQIMSPTPYEVEKFPGGVIFEG